MPKKSPNGIPYDTEAGIMASAFRISSTIIPLVVDGPEFWVLCVLNIAISVLRHQGIFTPEDYNFHLPWGLTSATGSLMTFFVCFYNKHVFERYNMIYDLAKFMEETCLQIVSSVRVQIPSRTVQRKVAKMLLVSCFMFFYERTGTGEADSQGSKISKLEYAQLRKIDLLDETEIKALQKYCKRYGHEANPSLLTLQWCMQIMRRATPEPETRDDLLVGFDDRLYELRGAMADVSNIMDLPMPFQYFHIMNMMLVLNLLLWAYALGCQDSYWSPVIYMFVQMMFQGVRELSTALSDPFGDDEVDFDVNAWMRSLYTRMYAVLEDPFDLGALAVSGEKPLKDPDSNSRKINLLVDREIGTAADVKDRRRRVKRSKPLQHPWNQDMPHGIDADSSSPLAPVYATHRQSTIRKGKKGNGGGSQEQGGWERELELRRNNWFQA